MLRFAGITDVPVNHLSVGGIGGWRCPLDVWDINCCRVVGLVAVLLVQR